MTITPWDLFYAHAAGGYLAMHSQLLHRYDPPKPEDVAEEASKIADAMMAKRHAIAPPDTFNERDRLEGKR